MLVDLDVSVRFLTKGDAERLECGATEAFRYEWGSAEQYEVHLTSIR